MAQYRRRIARDKILALSEPQYDRRAHPGRDDALGILLVLDRDAIRPAHIIQCREGRFLKKFSFGLLPFEALAK